MSETNNNAIYRELNERRDLLAEAVTAEHYRQHPELEQRYGAKGREKCLQDAHYHLSYLSEAVAADRPALFADYVAWAKAMLAGRGIPAADLANNLQIFKQTLRQNLSQSSSLITSDYLDAGLTRLNAAENNPASFIRASENSLAALARAFLDALLAGKRHVASRLILDAVENGTSVKDIYLQVFQPTQHEVGRLWQTNELSVAQEHYCTAATQLIMSQLYPHIFSTEKNGLTLVATCISGDLHEIGVRMVSDFFEMEGWDTFYLGANTPTPALLGTLKERDADLIVISATMTFHLGAVKELIHSIRNDQSLQKVKIIVGGYPFNVAPDLWREIGADAFSTDALEAVRVAENLVRNR